MTKKIELTVDEKWDLVRRHYNNAGYKHPITKVHVRLNKMPAPYWVNYLFTQMIKLYDAEFEYKRIRDKKNS